ncbi:FtsX-like permease family protein [Mucilaginibacter pallidiroseus]|uniref:FtsX-like permease family protein n=1 Tax=Mucilaginibacter pallidiroseus TaxID=2599295 RepID=A0A563UJ32_9SPHI|nr:ABC transporter permease [Mucilaginibacter pallidiroseus]TWR31382.1 FtsX-like permease family protein [Mucilaginibacter pallidiroseus]
MFKNYLKIAWRNVYKNKTLSLIHILGLTIGITVCMMIFIFIMNEFSVDNFHTNKQRIYRVMRNTNAIKGSIPYLSGPYATALLSDFPADIKRAVRVEASQGLITFDDKSFAEKKLYIVDNDFFQLFTFPLILGNPASVLQDPSSVVLTETAAKKYFGSANAAMGKVLTLDKKQQFKVSGVAKDVPVNSHLEFDIVVPIANYVNDDGYKRWINNRLYTYILLDEKTNKDNLEAKLPQFMENHMGKDMARFGTKFSLSLTALPDVYFEKVSSFDNVKHGDKTVVYIFISIAVLILLIACINFTNLSTIRAVERSKEVGLRKVLGALKNHLVLQFIGESILLTVISCALSIGLLLILMPWYRELLGYQLSVSWNAGPIYLFLVGVILVIGFLAGSYPAFFLSAFSPIQALKGKLRLGKGGAFFRQALVVVQFSISLLLIIGTTVIMNQMRFVKNQELGYTKEQTIIVPIDNDEIYNHRQVFKKELEANSNIAAVSLMSGEPGGYHDVHSFNVEGQNEIFKAHTEFADFEFVKTLGLKIVAGRDLSPQFSTDSTDAALINETAAKRLGLTPEQALGKLVKNTVRDDKPRRVVGVIKDYNFLSLKEGMDALVISPSDDRRVAVIRLKPGNLKASVQAVKQIYGSVAPAYPLDFSFLDQKFDTTYKTDIRQQTMLTIFSGLAIFIACLGLFGLASFTAVKRTKEIGVRKVLGSSVANILLLLSKDLLKPVFVATFIAIPLGYYFMQAWLQNFAYRTPLHWWIFAFATLLTFAIALITVSFKSLKAALVNPVRSLRSE